MIAVGLGVFLIRFQHEGPYGFPQRGNLAAGVLSLGLGALLLSGGFERVGTALGAWLRAAAFATSAVVLFFALYAIFAELEEVVVVYANDSRGAPAELRLWVVDHEGVPWVSMPRTKAEEHGLDGARVEWLRGGVISCIAPVLSNDPADADRTFALRDEKYAVQRLARRIGLFGEGPSSEGVALRIDPCP